MREPYEPYDFKGRLIVGAIIVVIIGIIYLIKAVF
jgi:hypothetical protein